VARRRLTASERRAGILDAALEVFALRGYHGASIDEIAGAAGISKALIYEHFESKRELHDTLLEHHAGELFRRFQASAAQGGGGEERLRRGVDAFFGFVEEHREAWRALFRDSADPELQPVVDRLQEQATGVIVALSEDDPSVPAELTQRDLEMHARMLSGACQNLANWWYEHQDVPRHALVERVVAFVWRGLGEASGRTR
jgi:AcrR family transcriptional regulator